MKICFFLILWFYSTTAIGQVENIQGIKWTQDESWFQILDRARRENKIIFLDCYTTWCAPCKIMDKTVYNDREVGSFMNKNFVNVKVQFDKTDKDETSVKLLYLIADTILIKYRLQGYPSFLFFDTTGRLFYKKVGFQDASNFLKLAKTVLEPDKRTIFNKVEDYKIGEFDYETLPILIEAVRELMDEKDLEARMARDYYENFLQKTDIVSILLTKENVDFVSKHLHLLSSQHKLFKIIFTNRDKVDSIAEIAGICGKMINYIITKEEIYDKVYSGGKIKSANINWSAINNSIIKKYGMSYANILVPPVQLSYYYQLNKWSEYIRLIEKVSKLFPPKANSSCFAAAVGSIIPQDDWALNWIAWNLFLKSNDKSALIKALQWIDSSLQLTSSLWYECYDTKANLTYKLNKLFGFGTVTLAKDLQKLAILKSKEQLIGDMKIKKYESNLTKMEEGMQTW